MSDLDEAKLDGLLASRLSADLDGQLGRTEAAFLRRQDAWAGRSADASARQASRGSAMRWTGWVLSLVGTAAAASVATVWIAPALFHAQHPTNIGTTIAHPTAPSDPGSDQPMVQFVHSRTWDEGAVILEGSVPARRIVREELEQRQWYDAEHKAKVEVIVPRRDVRFVEMDTY